MKRKLTIILASVFMITFFLSNGNVALANQEIPGAAVPTPSTSVLTAAQSKISLISPTITKLQEQLRSGEPKVMENFWAELQWNSTPIIEPIEGDSDHHLVTFCYKGDSTTINVVVLPYTGAFSADDDSYLENQLQQLPNTDLWYRSMVIRNDIRFSYFFSVNDALDQDIDKRYENLVSDPLCKNRVVYKSFYGTFSDSYVTMPKAETFTWVQADQNAPKGKLHSYLYKNKKLPNQSHQVWIYTPANMKKNGTYDFLVLADGQDYINTLSAQNVLDNLIAKKKISPMVVIFVETPKNRGKELIYNKEFAKAIAKVLVPALRKKYQLTSDPAHAAIGGLSLGGLNAAFTAKAYPEVFGKALCQSGSFWCDSKDDGKTGDCFLANEFLAEKKKKSIDFYLSVGICEGPDMILPNQTLRDTLKNKGYKVSYEELKCGHDYLGWGEGLAHGLMALFGK